jgi:hypothetical protein
VAEETAVSEVATQGRAFGDASNLSGPISDGFSEALLKRAADGDESCLPEIHAVLDGNGGLDYEKAAGSAAEWFRQSLIRKAAGKNVLIQEAITRTLEKLQAELAGPNPTPNERLLAERAALCWFIVNHYEEAYVNSSGWNIDQADLQHRKIDKAHARFLSALLTLARIRKLALPTLQLNIARNQVNVAETGS